MEKNGKRLYMAPESETLQFCNEGFLCASLTGSTGLRDYDVQPEEEW